MININKEYRAWEMKANLKLYQMIWHVGITAKGMHISIRKDIVCLPKTKKGCISVLVTYKDSVSMLISNILVVHIQV